MDRSEGGSGGNYATGGIVNSPGFVLFGDGTPETVIQSAAGLVSRLDTSTTVARLIAGGFTPDSARRAVTTGDLGQLRHSGVIHVQLDPPGRDPDDGSAGVPAKV